MESLPASRALVPLALAAVYLLWGSTYLAIRVALRSFPPLVLGSVRFLLAGLVLVGVGLLRGHERPDRLQVGRAAVTGLLLLGLGNGLVCYAEQRVSSGVASVAVASMPLFATLFGALYRELPRRREALGLLVGFLGVVLLNFGAELRGSPEGAAALLGAAASWAWGSVWSKRRTLPAGEFNVGVQALAAGGALALASGFAGQRLPAHPSAEALAALAWLLLAGSLLGFTAYVYLLRTVRPALATSYAYVNPPVAVLLGASLAGEPVRLVDLAGMAVILLGVGLTASGK